MASAVDPAWNRGEPEPARIEDSLHETHTDLMEQLAEAALNVRRTPGLSDALAQRALLSIAMAARRREQ